MKNLIRIKSSSEHKKVSSQTKTIKKVISTELRATKYDIFIAREENSDWGDTKGCPGADF